MMLGVEYDAVLAVTAALAQLLVMAMLLERALAFLFEYHWFRRISDKVPGIKGPIVLVLASVVCFRYRFDVLAKVLHPELGQSGSTTLGILVTSATLAGWSLVAIALLQGVLNWSKTSRDELIRAKQVSATAVANEAQARDIAAQALVAEAETRRLRAESELTQCREHTRE